MLNDPRRQRLAIVATTHHQGFQPEALLHGFFRWQSAVSQNNGARAWGDGRLIRAFENSIKGEGRQSNRRDVGRQVSVQTATAARGFDQAMSETNLLLRLAKQTNLVVTHWGRGKTNQGHPEGMYVQERAFFLPMRWTQNTLSRGSESCRHSTATCACMPRFAFVYADGNEEFRTRVAE